MCVKRETEKFMVSHILREIDQKNRSRAKLEMKVND